MRAADGVGLAAPQIGVPLRMFVLDAMTMESLGDGRILVFVDPEIVWLSEHQGTMSEGCLSFPEVFVPIRRPTEARVRAISTAGYPFEMGGGGLLGRAIQHECDHLEGRLMIDVVSPLKRDMIRRKMAKVQPAA